MRARLLDMGDVNPLRSQSIYHAVTAAMTGDADPVVVLLRTASPCVVVSTSTPAAAEVDLAFCRGRNLPVFRRQVAGGAALLDENQLLFQVIIPAARAGEVGLPAEPDSRLEHFSRPLVAAYRRLGIDASFEPPNRLLVDGREIGTVALATIGEGLCFVSSMVFDFEPQLLAQVLRAATGEDPEAVAERLTEKLTSIWRQSAAPPSLAEAAEALAAACESCYGFELVPSLPTASELEAIYEWDQRLYGEDPAPGSSEAGDRIPANSLSG